MAAIPLHGLPAGTRPDQAVRNNGPDDLALQRFKIRELAEGWPMYRDNREWLNFQSIFHPDGAHVYTTWTGRTHVDDFIKASQAGMDTGAFIMHRIHGSSVDIQGERAICKMKATITQRFMLEGCEVDAESDCRFCFFFERYTTKVGESAWGAKLVRHWYEKDKLNPVDPRKVPELDDALLSTFPPGYRYLGYCQEKTMKAPARSPPLKVKRDMPGVRGSEHDLLLKMAKRWLEGDACEDF